MWNYRLIYTLCISIILGTSTLAQRKTISGTVRDFHSDEPVPFASVYFKGTLTGTSTDSAGAFYISVSKWPSDTIEITCVGYQPFKLYVPATRDSLLVNIR